MKTLRKILHLYPNCNCFIHVTICKLGPTASKRSEFSQIKYWAVDRFHGTKHGKFSRHSPQNDRNIDKRLKDINTSVTEMIFSWFRGYARVFNGLKKNRHNFLVLYYSKLHKEMVDSGQTSHLNEYKHMNITTPRNKRRYVCQRKNKNFE